MSVYIKIILLAFLVTFLFVFLKSYKSEYAFVSLIYGGACILFMLLPYIGDLISEVKGSIPFSSYDSIEIFIKCTLICEICTLTKSFCRDFSNSFLASCVDLAEKTAVIFTAFPLIRAVLEIITEFIGV